MAAAQEAARMRALEDEEAAVAEVAAATSKAATSDSDSVAPSAAEQQAALEVKFDCYSVICHFLSPHGHPVHEHHRISLLLAVTS